MRKLSYLLVLVIAFSLSAENVNELPVIKTAVASPDDPFYPYIKRPLLNPSDEYLKQRSAQKTDHLPWTLVAQEDPALSGRMKLSDIVVDRITDPVTGKKYIKMYHGTTSDLENIFKLGASAIRYDIAANIALGKGFYMAADPNEAKDFACFRLGERKPGNPALQAMLLVIGIEDNDNIQGKNIVPRDPSGLKYSDDQGEALDKNIYFVRSTDRYNQFAFFKNIAPYIRIFDIILLPKGFGKTTNWNGLDGQPTNSNAADVNFDFKCNF